MCDDFGSLTIEGPIAQDEEGVTVQMKPAAAPTARFGFLLAPESKIAGLMIEAGD